MCLHTHNIFIVNLMHVDTKMEYENDVNAESQFADLPIVVWVCYLCYFGWKSTVFDLNVAEMICFDAVRVNVMQTVMPIHRMQ